MRRTLLVAGLMSVFAPVVAHAQSANVTLYGFMNLDAEAIINVKQDGTSGTLGAPPSGAKQNIYRVSSNVSRFGMRGTESLGGGLNAIFQVEYGVTGDNGGGITSSRETFAGLQGGWGTLKAGYFFSPYYEIGSVFGNTPTYRTTILAVHSLWANNGYVGTNVQTGSFGQRVANSVRYDSPNVQGFAGTVQVGGRDVGGDGGDINQQRRHAYVITGAGTYKAGPIDSAIAYEQHNNLRDGSLTNPKLKDKGLTVTGSYDFGIVKVAAAFERLTYDIAAGGDLKRDFWGLSGTIPAGPGVVYLGYFRTNDGKGSSKCTTAAGITTCPRVGALTLGSDTGAQHWEISYTYPLSKRTSLYAGYTMIDNEKNAAYNFGINPINGICTGNSQNGLGVNTGCGDSGRPQGVVLGIAHSF